MNGRPFQFPWRFIVQDCLLIVALFALPLLILQPLQSAAFVDDWIYHWSVKHLVETGQLLIPEYSSSVNPAQVIWGALFCLPIGRFSFAAARFSTWLLSASGLCAVYLTAIEVRLPRRQALLGAAALGCCPLYFLLSLTFMTDVGFAAVSAWASFAMVRAIRRRSDRWLIASALFAMLASGFRLPAVVLPLAGLLAMIGDRNEWSRRPLRWTVVLSPLLVLGMLIVWNKHHQFVSVDLSNVDNSPAHRLDNLKHYALRILPVTLPQSVLWAVASSGICLLPLALARVGASRRKLAATGAILLLLIIGYSTLRAMGDSVNMPLSSGSMWRMDELGASSDLGPGGVVRHPSTLFVGCAFFAGLLAGAILSGHALGRRLVPGESVLRWTLLGHILLCAVLWLFYDRYILPILPPLIVMTLIGLPRLNTKIALVGIALFAMLSLLGTRDHLAYNRTLWQAVSNLHSRGIPPGDIDAGYVVNGWFQYGMPQNAPRDRAGKLFVPWLTDGAHLPYVVGTQLQAGYDVVQQQRIHRWLGPDITLYVLKRR